MILRCLVAAVVIAQERWGFCDFAGLLEGLNIIGHYAGDLEQLQ